MIGLEVAATARRLGVEVTVVENAATPLSRTFGPEVGEWFRQLHQRHGVDIRCSEALRRITTVHSGLHLEFAVGPPLSADVVLAGVGAVPQTGWLTGSGLAIADGVVCASDLRTSAPNVVAAGDIVRWRNPLFGEVMRVEHWANAVEQGYHAAGTLLGAREDYRAVPYFWTDQHDAKVRFAGRAAPATTSSWRRRSPTPPGGAVRKGRSPARSGLRQCARSARPLPRGGQESNTVE